MAPCRRVGRLTFQFSPFFPHLFCRLTTFLVLFLPQPHSGPVRKVSWAHPEFGQLLASCSSDLQVKVHEEQVPSSGGKRRWRTVATLSDSRGTVRDVKFSSRHHGLKLGRLL